MKKFCATILAALIPTFLLAQNLDSCGLDNLPLVNKQEAVFLNNYFREHLRSTFDFSDKRLAFVTGSSATKIGSKSSFFNDVKEWQTKYSKRIQCALYVFTEEEKRQTGYDAFVAYWVKIAPNKARIVKRLKVKKAGSGV